ncbi:hypothetical protein PSQ20_09035 [Curvibacter sp. RS43]|jgi:hypothetical protein|uniref:Addiction module protein n=1 Tax=Curvibacter microcysteis TaxID=3026419 RepID=A0ABT5MHE5_9BURK|nr:MULTISPECIES: hypothetical protein [unclassified Curvibacter]MDD0810477.1 hypothetical protein [Curvibacter sp. RS43]MDD0815785.1 hypothetical protein [Curvibacter sp. HBC28]
MSAQLMPMEPWIQSLVDQWVLTPLEADSLQDLWMEAPDDFDIEAPPHLRHAFEKLALDRSLDSSDTLH